MEEQSFITGLIPHRPPFLWLDRVVERRAGYLVAEKTIPQDLPLFDGHYPGRPILPGVLLCEAVFQAGALLIACGLQKEDQAAGVPVLARIQGASFKREVGPGAVIRIRVDLIERLGPAWFLKGKVSSRDRIAMRVKFSCTLKP